MQAALLSIRPLRLDFSIMTHARTIKLRTAVGRAALALLMAGLMAMLGCSPAESPPPATNSATAAPAQPPARRAAVKKSSAQRPVHTASTEPGNTGSRNTPSKNNDVKGE